MIALPMRPTLSHVADDVVTSRICCYSLETFHVDLVRISGLSAGFERCIYMRGIEGVYTKMELRLLWYTSCAATCLSSTYV
jgi:hypothetical protein